MRITPEYVKAFGLLGLCGFACYGIWTAADFLKAQKDVAPRLEAAARTGTQEWLDNRVMPLVAQRTATVLEIADRTARQTTAVLAKLEQDADQRAGEALQMANSRAQEATGAINRLAGSVDTVAQSLPPLVGSVTLAVEDIRPSFQNASLMAQETRTAITPELRGLVQASTGLLQQATITAKVWNKESPAIAQSVRETTVRAAEVTRKRWYLEVVKFAAPAAAGILIGRQAAR